MPSEQVLLFTISIELFVLTWFVVGIFFFGNK